VKPDLDIESRLLAELESIPLPRIDRMEARYRRPSKPRSRRLTPMLSGMVVVAVAVLVLTVSTASGSAGPTAWPMRFASMVSDAGAWHPFGPVPEISPTPDRATPDPNGGQAGSGSAVPAVTPASSKTSKAGTIPSRDGEGSATRGRPSPTPGKDGEKARPSPSPSPSASQSPSPSPEPSHSPD
jgi:hypothetical protein